MTGRLARVWWHLLLGALQCKRAFSSGNKLQVAVNKVVAGSWSGDDISKWDVSGVKNMKCVWPGERRVLVCGLTPRLSCPQRDVLQRRLI